MSEVAATLTNLGRRRRAQSEVTGKGYRVVGFVIGSQGHDPEDPLVALDPDPELVEIPGQVFGEEPIDARGYASATCPWWQCRIEQTEAVGAAISSIGLVAEIVSNGTDPVDEVGVHFLYAIANLPLNTKTGNDTYTFTVGLQQ